MSNFLTCCTGRGRKAVSQQHAGYRAMEKELMMEESYSDTSSVTSDSRTNWFKNQLSDDLVFYRLELAQQAREYDLMSVSKREEFARTMSSSWLESPARILLDTIHVALETGVPLPEPLERHFQVAMSEAAKIDEIAEDLVGKHPILTAVACAIVAIGILYLFWPELLEILGFAVRGPAKDSFASWWQSQLGDVPWDSFFAYLQRLAMTIGK